MLQWGTVFTNDCYSRLVGSITKVWQPLTSSIHTRKMSDINELLSKVVAIFLSNPEFLALTRLNIGAACCNEALHSPMIVAVGWLGPLPRSDNPWQAAYTHGTCQTSMMCCQRCGQIFVTRSWNSHPYKTQYQCTILQWGTVFPNDCCSSSRLVGSIAKVWQPFTSNIHTRNLSYNNDVLPKMWPDFWQILKFLPLQDSISVHHLAMRHCIPQWLLQ